MSKFKYIETTTFDGCKSGCPFCEWVDDDYHPYSYRCKRLDKPIEEYKCMDLDKDFRNENGVLDGCPFEENNTIKETDEIFFE